MESKAGPVLKDVGVIDVGSGGGKSIIPHLDAIINADQIDKPKAIILLGEVSGSTPEILNPKIREIVKKGISVFIVCKAYGEQSGIHEFRYQIQIQAAKAGAIHLRDANLKTLIEVANTAQTFINQGITGEPLNQAMIARYGALPV